MNAIQLKILVGGLVGIALAACAPSSSHSTSDQAEISTGIVGGTEVAAMNQLAKSVVGLIAPEAKGTATCTGTLLANNLVLTAAHCIGPDPRRMIVAFSVNLSRLGAQNARPVDNVAVNPLWGKNNSLGRDFGDIAIVHYMGSTPLGYAPVSILPASSASVLRTGVFALIAGYGVTNGFNDMGSGVLRSTSIRIADPRFSNTEIKLDQTQGHGACRGDSGGPAFVFLGGQAYVWGVTHGGISNQDINCTGSVIYTSALVYADWVDRAGRLLVQQSASGGIRVVGR